MVRYLFRENVNYVQPNGYNSKLESGISEETKSESLFWNKKAKKPTKFTFILLISFTLILLIWGIIDTIEGFHEIKVEIDYSDDYYGYIEFHGGFKNIEENIGNEYTIQVRKGNEISVYVQKLFSPETLTVKIYDNGELVREESISQKNSMNIEYTVGE
jgi:hypothetical protein